MRAQNYLAVLLDTALGRTFIESVRAYSSEDAGAFALLSEEDGPQRYENGYLLVGVFSSKDLREFADEVDAHKGPIAPDSAGSDVVIKDGIFISE